MSEGFYPDSLHRDANGDHIHEVAQEGRATVAVTQFDYAALDPEIQNLVPMDTVASAFVKILDWIESANDLKAAGARAAALRTLLDPIHGKYRNLSEISRDSNLARATLSKALITLRDAYGIRLSLRLSSGRQNCRIAQLESVKAGTHASIKRHAKITKGDEMPSRQQIESEYNTLTKAVDRIQTLEDKLEEAHKSVLTVAAAAPKPAPVKPSPKPSPKPAPLPQVPRRAQDLDTPTLIAALDISSRQGAQETVRELYNELTRRRELKTR